MNIKYIEGDEDLPSGYYCKVGNVFYLIEDLINNKDKEIEKLNNNWNKLKNELGNVLFFDNDTITFEDLMIIINRIEDSDE